MNSGTLKKRKAGYLQITRKCNNNCIFCSNPKFDESHSIDYISKLLDEYKKSNITEVYLTGGEPTLHPHLFKLILIIIDRGMTPRIITNGIKLQDTDFFKKLISSGINSINISFHTHIDGMSQSIFGNKDVVQLQKKALSLNEKISSNTIININATINSLNYKYLPEFASFIIANYKKIRHIVFNFLDPGIADGMNLSSAAKNPWIVVKHADMEPYLSKALNILKKNNITFRVERVPLCYLCGNEQFCSETRKIVKNEEYNTFFLREKDVSERRIVFYDDNKVKFESCKICNLNDICAGVQKDYVELHGSKEFYPVFYNYKLIMKRILDG